ncbi:hypothetical protein [Fannyhessea vaginae]|uniref:hypothetical protein n=1 Tax=Fannyhessea vaginae TaxID=82135 RepID=UPI003A810356
MIYATFNDSMVSMLKSFIGCEFNSYEYVSIGNGAYGNLRIQINGEPYEIRNQQRIVMMNNESVDLSSLSIEKATGEFEPVCGDQISLNIIEDTIQDVQIIKDCVHLSNGDEILMDMAVVFKTKHTDTMFSRDAWFSEFITISDTYDLDSVYPICKAKDAWRNDDESEVIIHRITQSLLNI